MVATGMTSRLQFTRQIMNHRVEIDIVSRRLMIWCIPHLLIGCSLSFTVEQARTLFRSWSRVCVFDTGSLFIIRVENISNAKPSLVRRRLSESWT
jgi:hypothetical protein